MIELTGFTKADGPLTKRISLAPDGSTKSDGSACLMARGVARRVRVEDVGEFANLIERVEPNQAIALGALRPGLPDQVTVVTKQKLTGAPDVIARTGTDIVYLKRQPAFALIDFDQKGLQPSTAALIRERGGLWPTLISVLPALRTVAHVVRRSTSAGLYRADTGERLPGSGGQHIFVPVVDGTDIERFLQTLHERCWLAGFGWLLIGAGGQLLERSIVDRMVGAPERLVFEGAPILDPPLAQDRERRRPAPVAGDLLDTVKACPPLDVAERSKLRELRLKVIGLFGNEVAKARRTFIATRAQELAARKGLTLAAAEREIERQCGGVLRPDLVLPFDDVELAGSTVADVLADAVRFEGATLADPLEGIDYGRCVARIMRREDGTPWIHSFAHGRTIYELKHNATSVRAAIDKADKANMAEVFIGLALVADLDLAELAYIRNDVAKRSGLGRREMTVMLKAAQQERAAKQRQEAKERRAKERTDPRPQIARPDDDADWLPMMDVLNRVIGKSSAPHPPARDIDDAAATTRKVVAPRIYAYSIADDAAPAGGLPAPEQWLIKRLAEPACAEMIEGCIDFVDRQGKSVHLQSKFVNHYLTRADDALPTLVAVATLPLVLADGTVLGREDGFDRQRGIDFRIQPELAAIVPQPGSVTDDDVAQAMLFLTDQWLVDVATDYAGKCTIIAAGLTIIERSLLDQRPAFFITAGRRGGGKTTTLAMLVKAVTGIWPAAAAWSNNEDERRKALLSYFLSGVPYILWDNIARGTQISCPHIEKSCTAAYYADRKLGVSEMVATAAATIHLFTGNNIAPKGDLASRSLLIRIELDRYDPENREFKHPDPIGWTDDHRADILRALYTILIGNPSLKQADAPLKTRFKMWWRLNGSAVEHAAKLAAESIEPGAYEAGGPPRPCAVNFRQLFLVRDEEDEDLTSLAEALEIMLKMGNFDAADVAKVINVHPTDGYGAPPASDPNAAALREFLFGHTPPGHMATPKSIGRLLRNHIDEPVRSRERTLILRRHEDPHTKQRGYFVEVKVVEDETETPKPEPEPESKAPPQPGIPFVMTRAMKRKLAERGYSDASIMNMTPQQATDILKPAANAGFEVLGAAPAGTRCILCGNGGAMRIKHPGGTDDMHEGCAADYLAAVDDPPVKVPLSDDEPDDEG